MPSPAEISSDDVWKNFVREIVQDNVSRRKVVLNGCKRGFKHLLVRDFSLHQEGQRVSRAGVVALFDQALVDFRLSLIPIAAAD